MENKLEISILKTLLYADIFSYPLTLFQIHKFLISPARYTKMQLKYTLRRLNSRGLVSMHNSYYILKGRDFLIQQRRQNMIESRLKMKKAQTIAYLLSFLPTIQLIGVSGSLSLYNSKKHDDIDLFIITRESSLWITRFLVNIILLLLGEKRNRGETFAQNKICPNMYMTRERLGITKSKRNLFTAHEIAQVYVLFDRNNTYSMFLFCNKWVQKYLGNIKIKNIKYEKEGLYKKIVRYFSTPLEKLCFYLQYEYMKKRISHETVSKTSAQFHPLPYDILTLTLYELRVGELQKTLKKNASFGKEKTSIFGHNLASFYNNTPGS